MSRQNTGTRPTSETVASAIPRQFSGAGFQRPSSPLARPPHTVPQGVPGSAGDGWAVSPEEKAQFDRIYASVDTANRGFITGEQAVGFFSNSKLPEEALAQIWDLADIVRFFTMPTPHLSCFSSYRKICFKIPHSRFMSCSSTHARDRNADYETYQNSEGQLNRDEFAVAMYLIKVRLFGPLIVPLPVCVDLQDCWGQLVGLQLTAYTNAYTSMEILIPVSSTATTQQSRWTRCASSDASTELNTS